MREQFAFETIDLRDEPRECGAANADMARWTAAGTLEPFEVLYLESERADRMLANAQKMHVFLWQRLFDPFDHADGPGSDPLTEPFRRRWFEAKRSPIAAAGYATALYHTAFAYPGGSFADDVREEQWAEYNKRLEIGRDALAATEAAGRESQPWLWASYDYGRQDVSSLDEFNARFREAWSRDMSNTSLCVSHGIRLLPRWYGHDERDLGSLRAPRHRHDARPFRRRDVRSDLRLWLPHRRACDRRHRLRPRSAEARLRGSCRTFFRAEHPQLLRGRHVLFARL